MQVGQKKVTDERRYQKRTRVREMNIGDQFPFRIVTGPIHRFFHMWPTMVEDEETKVMKATWRSAHVKGDERTVLDQLANLDKALKQKHISSRGGDESEALSVLRKQDRYDYAIIPRIQGEQPDVCILEANWTVYNDIRNLSTQKHPTQQGMLMYGLHYMYDLVLTKGRNTKTKRPSYKVDVLGGAATEGKISINHLDDAKYPIENPMQFFSGEDLALIEAANWEIEEQDKPINNEKLVEYLKEFPIDLGRQDKKNASVFLFFNNQEDLTAIQNYAAKEALPHSVPNPENSAAVPPAQVAAPATQPVAPQQTVAPAQPVVQQQPVTPAQPIETEATVVEETAPAGPKTIAEEVPVTREDNVAPATQSTVPGAAPQPEQPAVQPTPPTQPAAPPAQPASVPDANAGEGLNKPNLW